MKLLRVTLAASICAFTLPVRKDPTVHPLHVAGKGTCRAAVVATMKE
jgi:hypothetical protein